MRTNMRPPRASLQWAASLALCFSTACTAYAAPPVIQGVVNAANFQPVIASATWVTISGTNLATSTSSWSGLTNGKLPTALGGVTVTINNQPAYVAFVSPTQINVLVPDDPAEGAVRVQVTNSLGTSNTFSVNAPRDQVSLQTAPALVGCLTGQVDYITYSVSRLYLGLPDTASIGGTQMCLACTVQPPLYPEFASRMERSMGTGKNVAACYDANGTVFQVTITNP